MSTKSHDTEGKAKDSQGERQDCFSQDDAGGLGATPRTCTEARDYQIRVDGTNCQGQRRPRPFIPGTSPITGGIIRQLIAQSRNQLANRLDGIKRLENEVQEIEGHINSWEQLLNTLESQEDT